jgi:DNA-binding MarR family transcriptional regulator
MGEYLYRDWKVSNPNDLFLYGFVLYKGAKPGICENILTIAISCDIISKGIIPNIVIQIDDIVDCDIEEIFMSVNPDIKRILPLTEATYYTMLALIEPTHGYAVMQQTEQTSQGTVTIGPGTMYGIFSTLEKQGLIQLTKEEERRKCYTLTEKGKKVLREQIIRLAIMTENGVKALERL